MFTENCELWQKQFESGLTTVGNTIVSESEIFSQQTYRNNTN